MEKRGGTSGITLEDFFHRPELILIIAGILMLIGALGPWFSWTWGGVGWAGTGWSAGGTKAAVGIMGLIMLYSSVVTLGYVNFMKEAFPVLAVSSICGIVALFASLGAWSQPWGGAWGLYLTLLASLIALFAAFRAFSGTRRAGPSGPSSRGGGGL